ncbi:MAG: winged helix-turn-helix domain-containing protein [Spirulinaceae cyanobacterium RM2_2_10]|nr:winged helix-turn-helix domain-containing protein [Spirulinaceae cyanobacterium RM2_2_10]
MAEQTGIKLSGRQVGRILVQKKFVYIWAKYSLEVKRDSAKREECKARLANYKRVAEASPEKLQLWFWDAPFQH